MLSTVQLDLDCMYRVSGHFNYLEYMSPDTKFSFPREVTNLARLVVARAKGDAKTRASRDAVVGTREATATAIFEAENIEMPPFYDVCIHPTIFRSYLGLTDSLDQASLMDLLNLDNGSWGTLVSWPEGDDVAIMDASQQDYGNWDPRTDANLTRLHRCCPFGV